MGRASRYSSAATTSSFFTLALLLGCLGFQSPAVAAGELMVAPTRIVFDGRMRNGEVTLMNTGTETTSYRISFTNKRMTEAGGFQDIDTPAEGERFAENLIRFSPRQVTLGPGESQVIRLLLRKPANLDAGEYRSHMVFKAIPPVQFGIEPPKQQQGMDIRLIPVVAISIPVIVRHGETKATAQLAGLKLHASEYKPLLSFDIEREGNRSLFGDLTVSYRNASGKEWVVGQANGIAVYTPLPRRTFELPLVLPVGVRLQEGTLRLSYRARPQEGGATLAEAEIELP